MRSVPFHNPRFLAFMGRLDGLSRRENLAGLPPTWLGVGELDLFFEENRLYAQRLESSGVDCTFHQTPGAPHAFDTMVPKSSLATRFVADYQQFLRKQLAPR